MSKIFFYVLLSSAAVWSAPMATPAPPSPTYSSWNLPVQYTPGPSAVIPMCSTECRKSCTLGLEVCIGMMTHLDTSTDQLDPTDPNFYVYCACQKSTIVRSPGVNCGPGTGVGRAPIPCPAKSPWVDGFNTTIPGSQGTVVQDLIANGAVIVG